jgi:subtilisin
MIQLAAMILSLTLITAIPATAAELPAWITKARPAGAPALAIPGHTGIERALQEKGTVRVIVRLTPPKDLAGGFALEGTLKDKAAVAQQRAVILQLQDKVLTRVSRGHAAAAKRFEFIPFMALEVDTAEFQALTSSPEIDYIEEDIPVPPTLIQSVPLIGGDNGAFDGYTGSGQTVAILDTGVDKTHPFLTGKVVAEACFSTTDVLNQSTAVCASGSTAPGAGLNCSTSYYGCDHGTHVAGIAAGKNASFSGVAKDATIIAVQVFSQFPASVCGTEAACVMSWTSDQIAGLQHIYSLRNTYNISSANMSLGGKTLYAANCDSINIAEKAAIDTLRSVGIATAIASGNSSSSTGISSPGCISTAISVGATTKADVVASYSNSAPILNLLAPGSSIYSSVPGGGYESWDGTSMATPHVTGAWAVLKSAMPTASVTRLASALAMTGVPILDTRNSITKPRIQLDAAVHALMTEPQFLAPDILWRNTSTGANVVWHMDGVKQTGWAEIPSLETTWQAAGTGDFNGDGKPDILYRNTSTGENIVWYMDGATKTGWGALPTLDTAWQLAGIGDFNGDGKPDIIWRNTATALHIVWYMDGTSQTGWGALPSLGVNWWLSGIADFNGDGKMDILWRHTGTGATSGMNIVWYMDGISQTGWAQMPTLNKVWQLSGVADYNGDGKLDILWRNTSTGENIVWYMDGFKQTGWGALPTLSDMNWQIVR